MRQLRCVLSIPLLLTIGVCMKAEEIGYSKTKLADVKGKQANANLIFSDSHKSVIVTVADDRTVATIPYGNIDKLSYEFSKHHRIKQGAVVMVASLGAGAVVMLTKSKNHWLTIEYHEGTAPKTLVLRMDKKEYKSILTTATTVTGKTVSLLNDAGGRKRPKAS